MVRFVVLTFWFWSERLCEDGLHGRMLWLGNWGEEGLSHFTQYMHEDELVATGFSS